MAIVNVPTNKITDVDNTICNHTDKEIAESFIEVVKTVKYLLPMTNDWISVKDEVPDRYTKVLCRDIYENMYISEIFADEVAMITGFSCYAYDGTTDCVEWMPLPPSCYETHTKVQMIKYVNHQQESVE